MFRNQEIDGELRRLERSAVGPSALRRSRGVLRLFVDRGKAGAVHGGSRRDEETRMKKQIIVGGTLRDAADRVADAWRRAERGEPVEAEDNVTFLSWSALASHMTEKRYELLRRLHKVPAVSIRALARDLGRDFKRVHEDVKALEGIGLVEREDGLLRADYDEIRASISLDAPAA
jgi:predicted transcriptional regulator